MLGFQLARRRRALRGLFRVEKRGFSAFAGDARGHGTTAASPRALFPPLCFFCRGVARKPSCLARFHPVPNRQRIEVRSIPGRILSGVLSAIPTLLVSKFIGEFV